jgi:hypothetical protein
MTAGSGTRATDAEREAAATGLKEHFASGRLTHDELNEYLNRCLAAETRGDLAAVLAGLHVPLPFTVAFGHGGPFYTTGSKDPAHPEGPPSPSGPLRRHRYARWGRRVVLTILLLILLYITVGVFWVAGVGAGLLFVLLIVAVGLLRTLRVVLRRRL